MNTHKVPDPRSDRVFEWRFAENLIERYRPAAIRQLATLRPAIGDLLTFCCLADELDSPSNWCLRRSVTWTDPVEEIIAHCVKGLDRISEPIAPYE